MTPKMSLFSPSVTVDVPVVQQPGADLPSRPSTSREGASVVPSALTEAFNTQVQGTSLDTPEARKQFAKLFVVARYDPRQDISAELEKLIPTLIRNPELLPKLYEVTTTEKPLFALDVARYGITQSELRGQFLAELISGAVDPGRMSQGPKAYCTAMTELQDLPPAELLRLGCDFAVAGRATTASGKEMTLLEANGVQNETRVARAVENSLGNTASRIRRPPVGISLLAEATYAMGVKDPSRGSGAFVEEFTDVRRNLRGCESAGAAPDAKILWDAKLQRPVHPQSTTGNETEVGVSQYIEQKLQRGEGVVLSTRWNMASATEGTPQIHRIHQIKALRVSPSDSDFIECRNPHGDLRDKATGKEYPPGTMLGDTRNGGFWFEVVGDGVIRVRKDVLFTNMTSAQVDYDTAYRAPADGRDGGPLLLGNFPVRVIERPVDEAFLEDFLKQRSQEDTFAKEEEERKRNKRPATDGELVYSHRKSKDGELKQAGAGYVGTEKGILERIQDQDQERLRREGAQDAGRLFADAFSAGLGGKKKSA